MIKYFVLKWVEITSNNIYLLMTRETNGPKLGTDARLQNKCNEAFSIFTWWLLFCKNLYIQMSYV